MIAVDREFAILDSGYAEHARLALVVLELDFGADMPEFIRHIFDVIGEGQFALVFAKAFIRREPYAEFIALCTALQCLFDFLDVDDLCRLARSTQAAGLSFAVAGQLRTEHLPQLADIAPDIVGIRGAACEGSERGRAISSRAVTAFHRALRETVS